MISKAKKTFKPLLGCNNDFQVNCKVKFFMRNVTPISYIKCSQASKRKYSIKNNETPIMRIEDVLKEGENFLSRMLMEQKSINDTVITGSSTANNDIYDFKRESEILLSHVLFEHDEKQWDKLKKLRHLLRNCSSNIQGKMISREKYEQFHNLLHRRVTENEPVQYITGEAFFHLNMKPFFVNKHVLIPRSDSETLINVVLDLYRDIKPGNINILEVGVGSGALLITLLLQLGKNARGIGIDISTEALKVANINLQRMLGNDAQKRCSMYYGDIMNDDILETLRGIEEFDIIISNPPYIPTEQLPHLQKEVLCEPLIALHGGKDGLDFYRRLHDISSRQNSILETGGYLIVEIGSDQANQVASIFQSRNEYDSSRNPKHSNNSLKLISVTKDLGNHDRVVCAKKL